MRESKKHRELEKERSWIGMQSAVKSTPDLAIKSQLQLESNQTASRKVPFILEAPTSTRINCHESIKDGKERVSY